MNNYGVDPRTYYFGPKGNPFHFVTFNGRMRWLAGLSPRDVFAQHAAQAFQPPEKSIAEHLQKVVEGPTLLEQVLIP